MPNAYIPDPQQRIEQVVLTYLSSSLAGTDLIDPETSWYAGMSQDDKEGPAVVVACDTCEETYWQTRVYRGTVAVLCKQVAWDSTTSSLATGSIINLGGNVHALLADSGTAVSGINAMVASSSQDVLVHQTQMRGFKSERIQDSWISGLEVDVIFKLYPNTGPTGTAPAIAAN